MHTWLSSSKKWFGTDPRWDIQENGFRPFFYLRDCYANDTWAEIIQGHLVRFFIYYLFDTRRNFFMFHEFFILEFHPPNQDGLLPESEDLKLNFKLDPLQI
jgi:hypothetical protein